MFKWIKAAPDSLEIILVLLLAFGWFTAESTVSMVSAGNEPVLMDDVRIWVLLVQELVLGGLAALLLLLRGRRPGNYGCRVSVLLTVQGVLLGALTLVFLFILYVVIGLVLGDPAESSRPLVLKVSPVPGLLLVLIHPVFQEFFSAGYLITSLRERWGAPACLLGSVALRVVHHTYLGQGGMLFMVCMGILFGLAYLQYRQLWPLFTGHAVLLGAILASPGDT